MLIKTVLKTNISVSLELYFDDDTVKKGTISKGDIVELSYRKDCRVVKDKGKIFDIFIYATNPTKKENRVILGIDFSDDYRSCRRKVPVEDIVDFDILYYANGEPGSTITSSIEHQASKPVFPPMKPPQPIFPGDDDNTDDDNDDDNTDDTTDEGHRYHHHPHCCHCRPAPPPKPLGLRAFYVGKRARVGRSKVL